MIEFSTDNLPYEKVGKNEPVCIVDEVPFDIPDSWEWTRLGFVSSYAETKKKIKAQDAPPDLWQLDLEDIEKGGRILEHKTVGERKAVGDKTFFEAGNVLYSKLRPYLLKVLVAPADGICTPEIVPFSLYGKILPEYIVAFLKSPYVDGVINAVTYGVKMPRVGTQTMTSLLLPLPPLNEQQRIVNKVNEVMPVVAKYDTTYSKVKELNETFPEALKRSILQWAVQGKLVPQDPADEPAEALLERIREEKQQLIKEGKIKKDKHESVIFRRDNSHYEKCGSEILCIDEEIPFDLPASWQWERLINIYNFIDYRGKTPTKTDYGVPLITAKNVKKGYIDYSIKEYISHEEFRQRQTRGISHKGDILFSTEAPMVEEQDISGNRSVWCKYTVRHSDYSMQIEFAHKLFFDCHLSIICSEQETVWQDNGAPPILFQSVHDYCHKKIRSFTAPEFGREILLYSIFLVTAVRRIHKNDIEPVGFFIITNILLQRIAMYNLWIINIV